MRSNGTHSKARYTIQVIHKAMRILHVLLDAGQPLSLDEISERAKTPKSTAFRIITNLLDQEYLTEAPGGGYWLGLKLLHLGTAVERRLDVRHIAQPHLQALCRITHETVYLATLMHDFTVLYLERAESPQPVAVMLKSPGMTVAAHGSALGKVLLAHQPENLVNEWLMNVTLTPLTSQTLTSPEALRKTLALVRERGYAIDDEENMLTICCIAAPIFDNQRKIIAAVSVAGPKHRMPQPLINSDLAEHVVDAAQQISAEMGCVGAV